MNHGLRSTYVKGCRCELCRKANTRYAKWRELDGAVNLVDSTPAREHIAMLRATGVGRRTIAQRSGVSLTVVTRLAGVDTSKPARRVRPETLRRILAVKPYDVAPAALVPGHGVQRRLQGLVAIGYTQTGLATRIGWSLANLGGLVTGRYPMVTRRTHDQVAEMFDQLHMTPGTSTRSIRLAKRAGWVVPLAWDDIDDPKARPTCIPSEDRAAYYDGRVERAQRLMRQGMTNSEVGRRLHLSDDYVRRARAQLNAKKAVAS